MKKNENVLTEEFLAELYNGAICNNFLCSIVARFMEDEFLPDKEYQMLNHTIKGFYTTHKEAPKYGIVTQIVSSSRAVSDLLEEIKDLSSDINADAIREQFENYLKLVRFKKLYREIGKKYDSGLIYDAVKMFEEGAKGLSEFSLAPEPFTDVAETFESRLRENKERFDNAQSQKSVNRFYIDGLDEMNNGRNLRTQLTIVIAMSGVGKSHFARWIGYNAAYVDGLDVLHIQLEGSDNEVLDAYSAALIKATTYSYEIGKISPHQLESFQKILKTYSGRLKVKAYEKFGKKVTTDDIRNAFEEFKRRYGKYPDVALVDSLDLLDDSSISGHDPKNVRFKRIAIAENLKDLALETNSWIVATYQSTIENQEWVNDEKNVLNGYNTSEAKGLQRPCTHLISLNQSMRESKEDMLRIHIAKARMFKRTIPTFRICTDYEHECFYDRVRTLNLPKDN